MLQPAQIQFYRDQGYLVVEDVFSAEDLETLDTVTDIFLNRARAVKASDAVFDVAPDHGPDHPQVRRIKNPTQQHVAYDTAMRNPRLLDILECLLGPAIRFDHAKLNIKPVGGGATIEWHQDWAFYPHTNDDLLAVGVFLEDCGLENGPLQVIPGSHKGPIYNHHHEGIFVGACDPWEFKDQTNKPVSLPGKAGSITIHHVRTLHGSSVNRGSRDRRLLLFSYAAIDAWPLIDRYDLEEFNSRIIRGEPTLEPRQVALPVRISLPRRAGNDSIFDDQRAVAGRSFAAET